MKKTNYFDAVHTTPYEKYVEEVLLRGLGDIALGANPLSSVLTVEKMLQHDKNNSAHERVRGWGELNEALAEHEAIFAGTGIEVPTIADFEDSGVVDFGVLKDRFDTMIKADKDPVILITPDFYDDETFYSDLLSANGLRIKAGQTISFLSEVARYDLQIAHRRLFLTVLSGNPLHGNMPLNWTVAMLDANPNNYEEVMLDADRSTDFTKKAFYTEYLLAQLLLKRQSSNLLDTDNSTWWGPSTIIQESDTCYFSASVDGPGGIIHISRFRKDIVINSVREKIIRNVVTDRF